MIQQLPIAGFTPAMVAYVRGETHQYPSVTGVPAKTRRQMEKLRRTYIRSILKENAKQAYDLPDFHLIMGYEIRQSVKALAKEVRKDWDWMMAEAPNFFQRFCHIHSKLQTEYNEKTQAGRPHVKQRYILANARNQAFKLLNANPYLLGEVEMACWGELRYGIDPFWR